jgi:HSP20 family molecular chaperone IbpA
MANFFEKLKKGMKIEESVKEKLEQIEEHPQKEEEPSKEPKEQVKKAKLKKPKTEKIAAEQTKKAEVKIKAIELKAEKPKRKEEIKTEKEKWSAFGGEPEGQLTIDVYQTDGHLVIQSAIAGIKAEDLDISIEEDVITIKGIREKPDEREKRNYFYQECYWGPFSREIILPVEVDPNRAEAAMKEGILTLRLPKIERKRKRKIAIKE